MTSYYPHTNLNSALINNYNCFWGTESVAALHTAYFVSLLRIQYDGLNIQISPFVNLYLMY